MGHGKLTEQITIRLSEEEKNWCNKKATKYGSMVEYIRHLLRQDMTPGARGRKGVALAPQEVITEMVKQALASVQESAITISNNESNIASNSFKPIVVPKNTPETPKLIEVQESPAEVPTDLPNEPPAASLPPLPEKQEPIIKPEVQKSIIEKPEELHEEIHKEEQEKEAKAEIPAFLKSILSNPSKA